MKKTLLVFALAAVAGVSVVAQQGSKWLGGSLTLGSTDNGSGTETSSFSIAPSFGYYLNDAWAIGIGVGYSSNTTETSNAETKSTGLTVNPFVRYKGWEIGKFAIFGQANLLYSSNETETTIGGVTVKADGSTTGLNVVPGLSYNLNESFALEMTAPSIFNYYSNSDNGPSGMSFLFNSGYSIQSYLLNPTFSFVY